MIIALFGDVHGHLPAMYDYVQRWEASYGRTIDAVIQAGDMGVFPDSARIDEATRHHVKKDKSELLAELYVHGRAEATHDTYFVRGNHEDFRFLNNCRGGPIDPPGRITQLDAATPIQLEANGQTITIGGLGGIQPPNPLDQEARDQLGATYYDPDEVNALLNATDEPIDLLVTHDGPLNPSLDRQGVNGSPTILRIIERLQPRLHVFGHYNNPPPPFNIGQTQVVPLNQEDVLRLPNRDGGMAILDTSDWSIEFVYRGQI